MLRTRLGRFSPAHPRNARELELFLKGPFRQGVPLLVGSVVTVDMPRRKTETGEMSPLKANQKRNSGNTSILIGLETLDLNRS